VLTLTGLSKAHGGRTLFEDVTLLLDKGRRIALLGGNGVGKTTLLEIVMGLQDADTGAIHRSGEIEIGYLPQDLTETATGTVLEEAMAGAGRVARLGERLHELEARLRAGGDAAADAMDEYGEVQSSFEAQGGYALEAEAQRVLAGLGFATADSDRPVRELSGGWRMRVALARLLLADPDILLLDEPTNHLDVDSVGWLEQHLKDFNGALLFVSHDRDFIDAVANRIVEMAGGTATEYVGAFADFVIEREEHLARLEAAAARQDKEIARTERFIERFRYKATKARQVQSRVKALDKIERVQVPREEEVKARFQFPTPPRSPRVMARFDHAEAGYDDEPPILSDVDFFVERGMRIGLVGPNGAGKTTLLKLLLGELAPRAGSVTVSPAVEPAAFAQHQAEVLDPDKRVVEEFTASVPESANKNRRTLLGSFGFSGDAADRRISELSGGERTRLALAKIMVEPHNLLVLDEPTNHLDLPSCDILEDALRAYEGTVLLVTHDRHLIRSVATSLIEVRHGLAVWCDGVDEEILTPTAAAGVAPTRPGSATTGTAPPGRRDERRTAAERRQDRSRATKPAKAAAREAERRVEKADRRVERLAVQLADPDVYDQPEKIAELAKQHDDAVEASTAALAAWERALAALEQVEAEHA
jgi:ATP-binding cassette subfamily F protein 3